MICSASTWREQLKSSLRVLCFPDLGNEVLVFFIEVVVQLVKEIIAAC
jgi:hypothetical protein